MKKIAIIILLLLTCSILFSCSQKLDPKYEELINAIESGDYADARQELDKIMGNHGSNDNNDNNNNNNNNNNDNNNNNNNHETECTHNYVENYRNEPRCTSDGEISYSCSKCRHSYTEKIASLGHDFSDPTCTERARCKRCNTSGDDKLGHAYEKGYCTRCNADDPEMLNMYKHAVNQAKNYALHGYVNIYKENTSLRGHAGGKYLYELFTELGDYKDAKDYLARFSIIKDRVTKYTRTITDNLGNVNGPSEYDYQKYDKNGNIIFTEDSEFMEYYGIMATSNFSANVFYDENNVVTKLHIHFVSSQIDTIVIPTYDDNGVLIGSQIKTNTKNGTLNFRYNEKGERIYAETYDVWYHTFSARTYVYNDQGKLLEKHACDGRSELPESFEGMEMKLVHKYHYDENGKLVSASPVEYSNDLVTYEVDSKGRIIKVTSKSDTSVTVKEFTYEDCYIYTPAE